MTDIDPQADIELHPAAEHVTVRVPLAGTVTGEWLRCYQQLAQATKVPVQAQTGDDQAWIVVSVPASSDRGEIVATMDAARALIAQADAATRPPATAEVEAAAGAQQLPPAGARPPGRRPAGADPPGHAPVLVHEPGLQERAGMRLASALGIAIHRSTLLRLVIDLPEPGEHDRAGGSGRR